MNQRILFSIILLFSAAFSAQAQTKLKSKELDVVLGKWTGSITYLDYTSGKPFTMSANVTLTKLAEKGTYQLAMEYPDEPEANGADTLRLLQGGKMLDEKSIIAKKTLPAGGVEVTAQKRGVDGNDSKPALMQYTYTLSPQSFVIRKDVKFDGTDEWIQRHEYRFGR